MIEGSKKIAQVLQAIAKHGLTHTKSVSPCFAMVRLDGPHAL